MIVPAVVGQQQVVPTDRGLSASPDTAVLLLGLLSFANCSSIRMPIGIASAGAGSSNSPVNTVVATAGARNQMREDASVSGTAAFTGKTASFVDTPPIAACRVERVSILI